jgi:hypothetical protein
MITTSMKTVLFKSADTCFCRYGILWMKLANHPEKIFLCKNAEYVEYAEYVENSDSAK